MYFSGFWNINDLIIFKYITYFLKCQIENNCCPGTARTPGYSQGHLDCPPHHRALRSEFIKINTSGKELSVLGIFICIFRIKPVSNNRRKEITLWFRRGADFLFDNRVYRVILMTSGCYFFEYWIFGVEINKLIQPNPPGNRIPPVRLRQGRTKHYRSIG